MKRFGPLSDKELDHFEGSHREVVRIDVVELVLVVLRVDVVFALKVERKVQRRYPPTHGAGSGRGPPAATLDEKP